MDNQITKEGQLTQQIESMESKDSLARLTITIIILLVVMAGFILLFIKLLGVWGVVPVLTLAVLSPLISDRFNGRRKIHAKIKQLEIERGYRYAEYTNGWYKEILDKDGKIIRKIKGEMVFNDKENK